MSDVLTLQESAGLGARLKRQFLVLAIAANIADVDGSSTITVLNSADETSLLNRYMNDAEIHNLVVWAEHSVERLTNV